MPKNYRIAVIGRTGKGNYGHGLDLVWKSFDNVEIVAVADEDAEGRTAAAQRLKAKTSYADYRQMLAKERPQIVSVADRWLDRHRDMVAACAESGASIFLEKPFCRTLDEADAMVTACERHHVKLAIAHQTRYSPRLRRVQELIAQGRLGDLIEMRGRGKEDARGGGQDLMVLGTHIMDLIAVTDGGNGLEEALQRHLADNVTTILDWYHAAEHLCDFAKVWQARDEQACQQWSQQAQGILYEQGGEALLAFLGQIVLPAETSAEVVEELRKLIGYFQNNRHRTDYPSYRQKDWDIGSGPTEAGCKIIRERLKGSGMRWVEDGAATVAALRALYVSAARCGTASGRNRIAPPPEITQVKDAHAVQGRRPARSLQAAGTRKARVCGIR